MRKYENMGGFPVPVWHFSFNVVVLRHLEGRGEDTLVVFSC